MRTVHFNALAAVLQQSRPVEAVGGDNDETFSLAQWKRDVEAVADVCGRSNPAFDRERFLRACNQG